MASGRVTTISVNHAVVLNTQQACMIHFQQHVLNSLSFWAEHPAIREIDVPMLDRKRESILKTISTGLDMGMHEDEAWSSLGPLMIAFASYMERRGHWEVWHSLLQRAIETAQRVDDVDGEITLTALLARVCQRQSQTEDTVRYYRRVIQLARQVGNRFEEARACSNLGYLYIDGERWWRSEVLSQYALKLFEELDSEHGRAHTHNHLGRLYTRQEHLLIAEKHLQKACELWRQMDDTQALLSGLINLGALLNDSNRPQNALIALTEALDIAQSTGTDLELANIYNNLGETYRRLGNYAKAISMCELAERSNQKLFNPLYIAQAWAQQAHIYFEMGYWDQAKSYLKKSLEGYQKLDYNSGIHWCIEMFGKCEHKSADRTRQTVKKCQIRST